MLKRIRTLTYRACINSRQYRDAMHSEHRRHAVYFWSIATWSDLPRPTRDELFGTSVNVPLRDRRLRRSVSFAHSTTKREARKGNDSAGETHIGEHFHRRSGHRDDSETSGARNDTNNNATIAINWHSDSDTMVVRLLAANCSPSELRYRARRSTTDDAARRSRWERHETRGTASGLSSRRRRRGVGAAEARLVAPRFFGIRRSEEEQGDVLSLLPKLRRADRQDWLCTRRAPSTPETDIVSAHDTHVFTVRQGWPQHRYSVVIRCCCPGGCRDSLGQKRGSLIASPSPCHTCSNSARCRGVSPSSSRCRPSRSYLHALMSDIGPNDTTRTRMFHCRACYCRVTTGTVTGD